MTSQGRGLPFHSTLITLYNARVYGLRRPTQEIVFILAFVFSLLRDDETGDASKARLETRTESTFSYFESLYQSEVVAGSYFLLSFVNTEFLFLTFLGIFGPGQ